MAFKTELHCHSAPVSACAKAYPEEIVQAYVERGYHSLVLTNHFSRFTFKNKRMGDLSALPWEEKVDYYMKGYHELKEAAGDKINVIVSSAEELVASQVAQINEIVYEATGILPVNVKIMQK